MEELNCPCRPECPNYGKCRECIAAHAKYYTVPHCIKTMQNEMKEKHLHPQNPHVKKTLPERIEEFFTANPEAHLRSAAEELKITDWQLLDGMKNAIPVPVEDFDAVYGALAELDKVMLHLDTGSAVLQLTCALPAAMDMRGTKIIKAASGEMELTSLIFAKNLYAIFLVRETLYGGKESLSVAFVNEDESTALSVYLRRGADNTVEPKSKETFEALWEKYTL
ncbi:MAG: hypothetical protein IIV03_05320 [Clostridia bacterium]|nr:hypothetical protein [Clostridia bacterium]MBR0327397.1 hypothetical protein [Clostridia bacterium]